mmetsp:Transcript_82081/g.250844  ORF Transcript_82081/g.250844 Transcript_82081/m.250844 type:complete len:283 (+) Transcript_82081:247-1095(+)
MGNELGTTPLAQQQARVEQRTIMRPISRARALPNALDFCDPLGPRTWVHVANIGAGHESEGVIVGRHGLVGLDDVENQLWQCANVRHVAWPKCCDRIDLALVLLGCWHGVVECLPLRRLRLRVKDRLCGEHILHAVQSEHVIVIGDASYHGFLRLHVPRHVLPRVVHQRLPAVARADPGDADEGVRVAELVLRCCLLQVRLLGGVMRLLCEDVGPLPKVVRTTILHGLDEGLRGMPFPRDRGDHNHEERLVELPYVFRHLHGFIAFSMRVVSTQPLQGKVQP